MLLPVASAQLPSLSMDDGSLSTHHPRVQTISKWWLARLTGAQSPKKISQVNPYLATLSREETRCSKPQDLLGGVIPPARVGKDLQKLMGRCFWIGKKGESHTEKS